MNSFRYEGAVNVEEIDDPLERDSVIAQINNFGQTPTQLLNKPHPPRLVSLAVAHCWF